MKKVLFISYAFPPIGGGGIFRITKFVKFLPDFGILPRVLTVENPNHPRIDQNLLSEIPPEVEVTRVSYFEPARLFKARFWQSFLNYIWYPWFSISDPRISWYRSGLKSALEIIKKEKIDTIYTSFASATDHLIALEVKKRTGVRWVADFRDEWASSNYQCFPTPLHRARVKYLEKKVSMAADIITTVSEPITAYFRKISGNKEKCITITNGFDEEDFKNEVPAPERDYCQILYSGALYGDRQVNILNEVIKELDLPDLKVEYLGGKKHIEHTEAIKFQRQADILLLVLSPKDHPAVFTGKIFEYLAARRPILALAPFETEAAKLIKELGVGEVVNPTDKQAIKDVLLKFYEQYRNHSLDIPCKDISSFSRRNLTKHLADIFKSLKSNTRKIKICLIANTRSPQNERLTRYLLRNNYEVYFISLDSTGIEGARNYELKQKKSLSRLKLVIYSNGLVNKLSSLMKLRKLIKEIKPDIVHGHGINFAGILAVYSGFHPVVVTTRGSDVMKITEQIKPEQFLIKQTLKHADLVTGSSLALENKSVELGMPKSKFRLVFFGVDAQIFAKHDVSALREKFQIKDEQIIFCPRALKPVYNIDILLEAVSQLKNPNYKLILLDYNMDQNYYEKIMKLAKNLGVFEKIIFIKTADDKTMADLYNLTDVVVSIARSDGLSVSFLEAMASEAKIVLSDVGFAAEWYKDNNFWVVPIGDAKATASAIDSALRVSEKEFSPVGRSNRQLVLDRAEINRGFKQMEEVYQKLKAKS